MTIGRIPSVEGGIQPTIVDAKGDLIVATAADTVSRLAVGTNNHVLTADSSTATGVKWAAVPATTPTFVGCRLYNTTNQTISNNTSTVITYNSESYDTDGFHSTATNTSRITIPSGKGGYYLVIASNVFTSNSSGIRDLRILKNGSGVSGKDTRAPSNGDDTSIKHQDILNLAAGDYLEVQVKQTSGGNLSTNQDSDFFTGFVVQYLGA